MHAHKSRKGAVFPTEHVAKGQSAREWYRQFAARASLIAGSHWAFVVALVFLLLWACSYPLFGQLSDPLDSWQMVVNTITTVVTFLMVFLIQNTQNRDARALHLKLDELIRAVKGARNHLVDLEDYSEEELEHLRTEFERIGKQAGNGSHKQRPG